ncbi:MAG: class I SAM-dependent methyltransferase [Candidatus Sedimenticola sp. (ex Thyasira tokunagai)]
MTKQRHKYEYNATPQHAATKVVRMVGAGKRILELGSGPGSMTRLLADNQCRVTALELDQEAIKIVAQYCEQVYPCDLNDPKWHSILSGLDKFEAIVAGDVLEHLYDPWSILESLHSLLNEDGHVVISLPHLGHNAIVACLLTGDFEYQPWGLLDKTHIRFFAIKNIQRLFNDAGFKIVEVDFVVKTPEQTEFAKQWRQLSVDTRQALSCNKFGNVYQVVVKAVPKSSSGRELHILSQAVPEPSRDLSESGVKGNRIIKFLISYLSLNTRKRISHLIARLGIKY